MKSLLLIIFSFLYFTDFSLHAQSNINIVEDNGIRLLMDSRKELNFKKERRIKAWSVQLLVTRDKFQVLEALEEVKKEFKDYKSDWTYEQPYYKLNVGAYYTKLEATIVMHKFIKEYPDAYVFKNNQAKASEF